MRYVVDRVEGKIAVCNDLLSGENIDIDKLMLPKEVKEGDVIVEDKGKLVIDKTLTLERYKNINERMNKLFNKRL